MKPNVVALYTSPRKQGEDAFWYPEKLDSSLFLYLKDAHHFLMRTTITKGEPPIAVIVLKEGVGLLIADMPTMLVDAEKRHLLDAYNRRLSNTLYLEFDIQYKQRILEAAAALILDYEYGRYEASIRTLFPENIETIVRQDALDGKTTLTIDDVVLPELRKEELPQDDIPSDSESSKIAAFARKYRKNYAAYLVSLLQQPEYPLIFVSTGLVKKDEIQQYATNKLQNETLIVLTLSGSTVPDKEYLNNGQTHQASGVLQKIQPVVQTATQIFHAFPPVIQKTGQAIVQTIFQGNSQAGSPPKGQETDERQETLPSKETQPTENQPEEQETVEKQEASLPAETQSKTVSDSQEEKSTDAKNSSSTGEQISAGVLALFAIGSLFFIDIIPPQLASLMLQSSNLMQAAQTPILQRFDTFGKAQLAFSEAVQGVALSNQACEKADKTATTWNCAVALSSENPNQAETLTLSVAEVKDEAGNVMSSKTFTAQIESAEIRAELFDAIHFFQKDGIPIAEIQIKASAKYGVKAVSILDVPAAQTQAPEVWQAEIPLPITPKMPLTAAIRDAHDNEIRVRLP